METLTRQQLFARFETAYKMGLLSPEIFTLMERWCDAVHRLQGGQFDYFIAAMDAEAERTDRFSHYKTLANDTLGYQVIQLLAILTHPCQVCSTDTEAWHTRSGW